MRKKLVTFKSRNFLVKSEARRIKLRLFLNDASLANAEQPQSTDLFSKMRGGQIFEFLDKDQKSSKQSNA